MSEAVEKMIEDAVQRDMMECMRNLADEYDEGDGGKLSAVMRWAATEIERLESLREKDATTVLALHLAAGGDKGLSSADLLEYTRLAGNGVRHDIRRGALQDAMKAASNPDPTDDGDDLWASGVADACHAIHALMEPPPMTEPSKWAMDRVAALRDSLEEWPGDPIGWKPTAIAELLDEARREALEEAARYHEAKAEQYRDISQDDGALAESAEVTMSTCLADARAIRALMQEER